MSKVTDSWGGLAKNGWKALPNHFIKYYAKLNISAEEAMFIVIMHSFAHPKTNKIFPKVNTIATIMNRSPQAVRFYIRNLRRRKLLVTKMMIRYQEYDFTLLYKKLSEITKEDMIVSRKLKPAYQDVDTLSCQDVNTLPRQDVDRPYNKKENNNKTNRETNIATPSPSPLAENRKIPEKTKPKSNKQHSRLGRTIKVAFEKNKLSKNKMESDKKYRKKKQYEKPIEKYNCNDVGRLLQNAYKEKYGSFFGNITGKDRKQLKNYINEYGPKEVTIAAQKMIENWEDLMTIINISKANPSVAIFYGFRKTIIPWALNRLSEKKEKKDWRIVYDKKNDRAPDNIGGWSEDFIKGRYHE